MKKRIAVILSILLVMVTATTAFGIYADEPTGERLIKRGYTEEDLWMIDAILLYTDESVVNFIIQKYEKYQDWNKVCAYYGISRETLDNYIEGKKRWNEVLDKVPEAVMSAMKNEGWSLREIDEFVSIMNVSGVDFEYAWQQYKSGKTAKEIQKENIERKKQISALSTEFVTTNMSAKEYYERYKKIKDKDDVEMSEILNNTITLRNKFRERHRKNSGISDEEIAYCEAQGMTNPFDMFQSKYLSKGNNISFNNVVASFLKNKDWTVTTAEMLNIPLDEYRAEVERIKAKTEVHR